MDFTCTRCLRDDKASNTKVVCKDLLSEGLDVKLKKLYCSDCKLCVALQTTHQWRRLDQWLISPQQQDGWRSVDGPVDRLILYILSQIFYNENTTASDPLFDMPDPGDSVKIFWQKGLALGFFTVKPKGTMVHATREVYEEHTLDTAYVLPSCRRKGLGVSMLKDLAASRPGEDIAISTPISKAMAHVIEKFLQSEPTYRMKLWEVEGVGSQGNRKLLYYSLRNRLK